MRFIIFITLFLNITLFAVQEKNILILNSYHKGFEFSDTIISNIEHVFLTHSNINTNVLYMDSKNIRSRDYIKELSELYSLQLKNRNYDLIITVGSFAYSLAVKNFNTIANNKPILFIGLEEFSKELAKIYDVDSKIHGIIQKLPITDNINLILKFMPQLKKLYIINDRSSDGNETSPYIIIAIKKFKSKIKIEYLRDDTLIEFTDYFSKYEKDAAILFVRFSNTPSGEFYTTNEISRAINAFNLPVFVTNDLYIGKGALGGKVIPIHALGINTAKKAINTLYKKIPTSDISIHKDFKYIFDQKKLDEFQLKVPRKMPQYSVINKPLTFFDKYREFINIVFLATPFLLVVIIWLIRILYEKHISAKKLKERIEFDKTLLNAIDSPIFWQDQDGVILDANVQFCELIHMRYDMILGAKLEEVNKTHQTKKIIKFLQDLKEGKAENSQIIIKNQKGKKQIYFIKQTFYESTSSGSGVVTIFTDITKEQEIEEQKVKHTQYMIQQSKLAEIGEIFSSIAHQWKSPLVEITALAQDLFYTSNDSEKEEESYHINNIMIQSKYMTDTINDFQDFIMPSKQKTIFDVHETIKAMLNIVRHNMKYNYINITIHVDENINLNVYGYENEFMQAILNIINNAKDALLLNHEKNRNIVINLYNKRNYLTIDIIDNGAGIPQELVDKIFIQYYSTKEQGHGIGLYMTRLIIQDKLEGKITYKHIESGSCFRIKLNTTGYEL